MKPKTHNKSELPVAIPEPHRHYLLSQIERFLPHATVWAFGSRVKGTHRSTSDLDLAIMCDKKTARTSLLQLAAVLEESDLPFKVQLLDFNRLPKNMRENIKKQYCVLYTSDGNDASDD